MTRPLVVFLPHQLGLAEARRRVAAGVDQLTAQMGPVGRVTSHWTGDVLEFSAQAVGQEVTGLIEVGATEVRIEIRLPGVLGLLADKVRRRLEARGGDLLAGPQKR